ncbi:MAG: hypothetical protein JW795_14225 [Chitinivibrionales bacterium]|nr:hypothetical protein [Chitinivibrionales bacterium]
MPLTASRWKRTWLFTIKPTIDHLIAEGIMRDTTGSLKESLSNYKKALFTINILIRHIDKPDALGLTIFGAQVYTIATRIVSLQFEKLTSGAGYQNRESLRRFMAINKTGISQITTQSSDGFMTFQTTTKIAPVSD